MRYDAIVIGLGVMGAATCWQMARRGRRVLGLEARAFEHDQGSSHGQTRIIRRAYFEDPAYLPLLDHAYRGWQDLERHTGTQLIFRTGLLLAGPENGPIISGVRESIAAHDLDIADLTAAEAARRFPGFRLDREWAVLLEDDAGYLPVETCVRLLGESARGFGAELRCDVAVSSWHADDSQVVVTAGGSTFTADALVVCAGGWTGELVPDLSSTLNLRRKPVFWFPRHGASYGVEAGCPVFGIDSPDGFFYGFPGIDARGVKVGNHSGGEEVGCPADIDRGRRIDEESGIRALLGAYLPGVDGSTSEHSVCMYTMTPDGHFLIDRHPRFARVWVATGFSGHGFKFAPTVGQILADRVDNVETGLPMDLFGWDRG